MIDDLTCGVYLGKEEVALDVVFLFTEYIILGLVTEPNVVTFLLLLEVAFSLVDWFERVVALLLVAFTLGVVVLFVISLFLVLLDSVLGFWLLSSLAWAVNDAIWGCLSLVARVVWDFAPFDFKSWTSVVSVSSVVSSS